MVHTFFLMGIALLLNTGSCNKAASTASDSLTGSWRLTEQLMDPGDGSGTWKPASDASGYVRFNADSSMESNTNFLSGFNRYSVRNDHLRLYAPGTPTVYEYRYFLKNNVLEIYPNCIEKCGLRFRPH